MTFAPIKSFTGRLAVLGCVAVLASACTSIPAVSPSASPSPLATSAPTTPPYTLGPTANSCPTSAPAAYSGTATVKMFTNYGNIVIHVDGSLGAHAAGTFLALSRCGYYNNVIFHRIAPNFVIQTGDGTYGREPNVDMEKTGTGGPGFTIPDDAVTTDYKRGTVAIANTNAANSGSSQFFVVLTDTAFAKASKTYAIFGSVTEGMDVVDKIAQIPTGGAPNPDTKEISHPLSIPVITNVTVTTP